MKVLVSVSLLYCYFANDWNLSFSSLKFCFRKDDFIVCVSSFFPPFPCRWSRGCCRWCEFLECGIWNSELSNIHMLMLYSDTVTGLYKWTPPKLTRIKDRSVAMKIAYPISSNSRGLLMMAVFKYCICSGKFIFFKLAAQLYALQWVRLYCYSSSCTPQ